VYIRLRVSAVNLGPRAICRVRLARDLLTQCLMKPKAFSLHASLVLAGLVLAALGVAARTQLDLILYNPTKSLEPGFYIRSDQPVERGAVVTIPVHASRLDYVREGHVRAAGDRFLKRVAAMVGDRVCSMNGTITIKDAEAAKVFEADSAGKALPSWSGCVTLKAREVFLLGDHEMSFDGRYWGVTSVADIEATWRRFP